MKKLHDHDTAGDEDWNRFHQGLLTEEEENKCPMEEIIVIDHVNTNAVKVNAVKCKEKYWIDPSCDDAGPAEPSDTLQWGVP
eukprot:8062610-Prorocentrum_lima.AAC.1